MKFFRKRRASECAMNEDSVEIWGANLSDQIAIESARKATDFSLDTLIVCYCSFAIFYSISSCDFTVDTTGLCVGDREKDTPTYK